MLWERAKQDEKRAQVEQEILTSRDQTDQLQSVMKESEDIIVKLNKIVAEKAEAQKQMKYGLLFNFSNITCRP